MAAIRIPEDIWAAVRDHLHGTPGEHFAFLLADWTRTSAGPVFLVRAKILISDEELVPEADGWGVSTDALLIAVNAAVRRRAALVEAHNHPGPLPRFSPTDRAGLREFVPYILDSLPNRPYAATVWGDELVYGEYFDPGGSGGVLRSVTTTGARLRQLVSRDDDGQEPVPTFERQLPWFTAEGQRALSRFRVGVVGLGGTGSQLVQNLVYLGVRDFVLVDADQTDHSNMNRLVTATAADRETPKAILARRLIRSVAPEAAVRVVAEILPAETALDVLKEVDVVFGCVDNDGPRLVLNELALAYDIPYFDLAVGIDARDGDVRTAGGRVAFVLVGGPCLHCMGELDLDEARCFLAREEDRTFMRERRYVTGMDARAPAVISLNAAIAAAAANEFAVLVSGVRPAQPYTELDLLGVGREVCAQWMTPRRVSPRDGCVQCAAGGAGDYADIERYARRGRSGFKMTMVGPPGTDHSQGCDEGGDNGVE